MLLLASALFVLSVYGTSAVGSFTWFILYRMLGGFGVLPAHVEEAFKMDYFAVSLPDLQVWEDDMTCHNRVHCYSFIGLGHLGLGNKTEAKCCSNKVLEMNVHHQGAEIHLRLTV